MKKQLILIFVSILLMTTVFMTNQVKGATSDIPIENWDSYATGVTNGSNDYIFWEKCVGGHPDFDIDDTWSYSGSKCLDADVLNAPSTNPVQGYYGNITLLDSYSYIKSISIRFNIQQTLSGADAYTQCRFEFFDDTDTRVLKTVFSRYTGSNIGADISFNGVGVYDFENALNLCPGSGVYSTATELELRIIHLGDPIDSNLMNYSVYNATGSFLYGFDETSNVAVDWDNFEYLRMYGYSYHGTGGVATTSLKIDDIIINTERSTTSGGYGDFGDLTPICSGGLGFYTTLGYTETTGGIVIPWYPVPIVIGGSSTTYPSKYIEHKFPYTWSGTIYGVDLPISIEQLAFVSNDTNDYWLTINGIPSFGHPDYILPTTGGEYVLRWIYEAGITLTHEKPLFAFYCDEHTTGFVKDWYWYGVGISYNAIGDSLIHNDNVWYADNFFNGYVPDSGDLSMCYYVTTDTTKQGESGLSDIELVNFTGLYGYTFIEFYENTFMCYHGIGSNPHIMYYLNDTYLEADSPFYRYQIMQVGTNIAVYDGLISMTGAHKDAKLRIMDYEFTQKGQYYIVLYNTTDYGTALGSELYYSQVITVCDVGLGDPIVDADTGGTIGLDFSGMPVFFKVIIALLIIVVLTICPYFFTVMIGRGTDNHIELPALVYIAFFFIGIVASIMLGFLEIWVFFIVLVGLIITFAILWLKGKDVGGGE